MKQNEEITVKFSLPLGQFPLLCPRKLPCSKDFAYLHGVLALSPSPVPSHDNLPVYSIALTEEWHLVFFLSADAFDANMAMSVMCVLVIDFYIGDA